MPRAIAASLILLALCSTPAWSQSPIADRQRDEALRHYRLGQEFMYAEDFPQAEREFEIATQLDRLLAIAYFGLGQAYMEQRRYASAIQAFSDCRDRYDEIATLAATRTGEFNRRLEDEIQEMRDSLTLLRSGRIRVAGREHMIMKLETRITQLENARRRSGSNFQAPAEVYLSLGSACFRHGRLADAEDAYKAALDVDGHFGEAHNNLAVVYLFSERYDEARAAVEEAERNGYRVNPQLREDIERAAAGRR